MKRLGEVQEDLPSGTSRSGSRVYARSSTLAEKIMPAEGQKVGWRGNEGLVGRLCL